MCEDNSYVVSSSDHSRLSFCLLIDHPFRSKTALTDNNISCLLVIFTEYNLRKIQIFVVTTLYPVSKTKCYDYVIDAEASLCVERT